MADVTIKILEPADEFDLLTLEELKTSLGINDTSQDAQLTELIGRHSDVVSTLCNRVFAKEMLRETWRCLNTDCPGTRLFLSHWPVAEDGIEIVEAPRGVVLDPATYELEERSGKLTLFGAPVSEVIVTYTGGFDLPEDAPEALKQACELLIREDRATAMRQATAGMRSIAHRDARVMFFDPAAAQRAQGTIASRGGSALNNLLMHYVRLQV
jgi:Phage gp6-like head-tail connector protein